MGTEYKLEVSLRKEFGKKATKNYRKAGLIPGVYYSSDSNKSISFCIEKKELQKATKSGSKLYQVSVDGKLRTVLFKDVQYHPVSDEMLHIDLYGVKMDEKVQIKVSLSLIGTPIGVSQDGGNLTQPIMELEISSLPSEIPDILELDVSDLELGNSLHAGKVILPENVDLITQEDVVVASVIHAMSDEDLITAIDDDDDMTFEDGEEPEDSEDSEDSEEQKGEDKDAENNSPDTK